MSIDNLIEKIREKQNPSVIGLDPRPDYIPPYILRKHIEHKGETLQALADAYFEFNCGLIDVLSEIVPAVKPQSAFFEYLGPPGVEAYAKTLSYAKDSGLYVIADVKRNDIGSTAEAYSEAYLGNVKIGSIEKRAFDSDSITVNAYLGSDGIRPFLEVCKRDDRSIFVLVKTSNKSAGEIQDLTAGKEKVSILVGKLIEELAADTTGAYGYTRIGAVVGATYPEELREMRKKLKKTFFLVPGYGAQGGTAKDAAGAFDDRGIGAIINSSRAVICAWMKTGRNGEDFREAAADEALKMKDEMTRHLSV
ncbi:MAG: orotidine-5'-phosphate decarboxylase [Clostridiales bacterium]|jgi:orotidine-5'-phosphate decarboxylase|nr:orotidine-5'-phosphate decarboxylase [Clostridiales bacterium]